MHKKRWKIIDTRTDKVFLCNFASEERAQYRIDNNAEKTLAPFLKVVAQ